MVLLLRKQHPDTVRSKKTLLSPRMYTCTRDAVGTDLVDGEHVEVGNVVFLGVFDPCPALLLINQLSNVLVHKLALFERHHRQRRDQRFATDAAIIMWEKPFDD